MAVPDVADELFDLPAGEFVAARNALASTVKADGRMEEAGAVKALKRPTLAAWAVNQVVRADGDAYEALVAAGRTVQKAQRRALSGLRESGLRDASTARRGLVEALTDHAARVLTEAGARPESHLDDVAAIFEAASADPDAAVTIGAGRLSAPVRVTTDFSGTSALLAMSLPPTDGDQDGDGDGDGDPAAEQRRAAIRALEAARSRADDTALTARAAREQAEDAVGRAAEGRRVATEARAAADRAQAEADDLETRAEDAASAATVAAATVHDEAAAVEAARAALDDLS